jgi:hypothetical protein
MGIISVSLPSDGQTIDAVDYNVPINTIVNTINGSINADNITDGSITPAKLDSTQKFTFSVVGTVASAATITPDSTKDMYTVTALATNPTIAAPSGSPVDGQSLILRIKASAADRTLNWNGIYRAIGVTLPTTVTSGKTYYIGFKYNTADTKWDALAVAREA